MRGEDIHIGDMSAAGDDNRPTRICREPFQLERGQEGRHGLAHESVLEDENNRSTRYLGERAREG
jgi:hypothetical protein